MADLTVTATSVVKGTGAVINKDYLAGETITAGQAVYLKESDGKLWKAQADGTAAEAAFIGIALNGAAAGQPVVILTSGSCTIGATVAVGGVYCVSATAGGICPVADLVSSDYVTIIGYGSTTAILYVDPVISGIEKA